MHARARSRIESDARFASTFAQLAAHAIGVTLTMYQDGLSTRLARSVDRGVGVTRAFRATAPQ